MLKLIREIICLLDGGHFVRRVPRIVRNGASAHWVTRLACRCGGVDYEVEGLPHHPDQVLRS